MTARRYVACRYKPNDTRTYTFHADDMNLREGDRVKVDGRRGEGWQIVTVAAVGDDQPPFPTKPILGMAEEAPAEPAPPAGDLFGGDA